MQRTERGQCLFVLSTPTETDGAVFSGTYHAVRNTCTWTYRGDECGVIAVRRSRMNMTSRRPISTKDKCSKCLRWL
ncbi:hypothetical protein O5466_22205 [Escherichia coli]|nr:hypothetical protein [Escherichia coli]